MDRWIITGIVAIFAAGWIACGGDDTSTTPPVDAGAPAAGFELDPMEPGETEEQEETMDEPSYP